MKQCTTAIIAAGGFGKRFGVASASTEKCMVLVDGKPLLQHIVEDLVSAGIKDITFVVGPTSHQIRDHFMGNKAYEAHLEECGELKLLEDVRAIQKLAKFHFVTQPAGPGIPKGTAVPLWLARGIIPDDAPTIYMWGDQLYFHTDGKSEVAHLLEETEELGTTNGMLTIPVDWEFVHKYGIVTVKPGTNFLQDIVEKPAQGTVSSNLNNGGIYVVSRDLLQYVEAIMKNPPTNREGEVYLVDALLAYAKDHDLAVVRASQGANYLDCSTPDNLREANNFIHATKLLKTHTF